MSIDALIEQSTAQTLSGYLMIKTLRINNFRCFRKIELSDLRRVNIIVGPNGSGKTALLESLFLASGASPEIALRLRNFRGMGTTLEVSEGLPSLWKNLFHDFDQRKTVSIELVATSQRSRTLTISLGSAQELRLPLQTGKSRQLVTSAVEFAWQDAADNTFKSRPVIEGDKLTFPQAPSSNKIVFVPANFSLSPDEAAKRLSSLSRRNESQDLISVLREVYPDVENISVENSDGSWEVFVQVKDRQERIPMALHSSGASRLIAMILAITAVPDGVVLIDELENGFYYKTLPHVWNVLNTLAASYNCQIFASTHSNECLRAMVSIAQNEPDSFCLLNTEPDSEGARITVSSGGVLAAAIESGFEVR